MFFSKRANLDSEKTEAILVVCHGNVIRSFCCRALQVPVERWLNLSVDNGSIYDFFFNRTLNFCRVDQHGSGGGSMRSI